MTQRLPGVLCVVSAFVVLGACGGGGGSNAPTPTVVSITIASSGGTLVFGFTETFTAMALMSNGSSQAVTAGTWGTDAPAVATVNTSTGLVTPVATGDVTIFVDSQGVRGSKRVAIVKSYQGIWSGMYTITACSQTGDFATLNLCGTLSVGATPPVALNLTQTGTTISGQTALGQLVSAPFTTTGGPGGALSFPAQFTQTTLRIAQAWQLNVNATGLLAGTVVQTWTDTSLVGQGVVSGTMLNVTRPGSDHAEDLQPDTRIRSLADAIAAAVRRR